MKRGRPATGRNNPAAMSIRITEEMKAQIQRIAIQERRSTACIIRDLLEHSLTSGQRLDSVTA